MGFLSRLFGKKINNVSIDNQNEEPQKSNEIKMVPISKVNSTCIPEGATLVAESMVPASCLLGNLIFEKKYEEAIEFGKKMLKETPSDPGVHIQLMVAYFKGKEAVSQDYISESSFYAKQAIIHGHNTGYAYERLAKNLDKAKSYHQSLQLYNFILETEGFHFCAHGCGHGIDWNHRRDSILKKMDKALDTADDVLFSKEEINQILQAIKLSEERERQIEEDRERRIAEFEISREERVEEFRNALRNITDAYK